MRSVSCSAKHTFMASKLFVFLTHEKTFLTLNSYRSSFSDFAQRFAKDERFKGVEKMREREGLFNEYLIDVRKREKDEKIQRREQVSDNFSTSQNVFNADETSDPKLVNILVLKARTSFLRA